MCFASKNPSLNLYFQACKTDDIETVKLLYPKHQNTPDPNYAKFRNNGLTGIFHALINNSNRTIEFLAPFESNLFTIEEITIPNQNQLITPFSKMTIFLSKLNNFDIESDTLTLPAHLTPLQLAIIQNNLFAIPLLLSSLGLQNQDGYTALEYAIYTRSGRIMQILANTRILNLEFCISKSIQIAVKTGNYEILSYYNEVLQQSDEFMIAFSVQFKKGKIEKLLKEQILLIDKAGILEEMNNFILCSEEIMKYKIYQKSVEIEQNPSGSEPSSKADTFLTGNYVLTRNFQSISQLPKVRPGSGLIRKSTLSQGQSSDAMDLSDDGGDVLDLDDALAEVSHSSHNSQNGEKEDVIDL